MNYKQDTPYFLEQTIAVARAVKIPVILTGGVRGRETAERVIAETPISYIGMARSLSQNPALVNEWHEEQG